MRKDDKGIKKTRREQTFITCIWKQLHIFSASALTQTNTSDFMQVLCLHCCSRGRHICRDTLFKPIIPCMKVIGHTHETPEKCRTILLYQSIFVIKNTIWKPTELRTRPSSCFFLIFPSCLCCFVSNRHTELIVGSKRRLIMTVNHQRCEDE